MATFVISYDLCSPGQDYEGLYKAIKNCGTWWHHLDSTWIVVSTSSSADIRDKLTPHCDKNDKLLVAKLTGEAAWTGFNDRGRKWLKDNL